jgi:hypothetical protein
MGVIAQEVHAEFPDLIEITAEGLLKVDYGASCSRSSGRSRS